MATDIQQLLRSGESETLEFKQSVGEIREIIETAGAFANVEGGTIVIGVSNTGKVLGVDIGKNTLESMANSIQQQTDPKVFPSIRVAEVEGRNIVILRIEESPIKPVLVQGRGYKRVGKSYHVLSSSELTRLFFSSGEVSWDAGPSLQATLDDIDAEALRQFLQRARQERNMAIAVVTPLSEVLEKLELLYEGRPSRAAVLLFGKRPQKFLLSSELRCARFKGTEPLHFIDMKVIEGNIIEQVPATKKYHERPEQIQRQQQAIEYVRERGNITTQGYAQLLGVSARTAHRDLIALTDKGILRRVGQGKSVHFELA